MYLINTRLCLKIQALFPRKTVLYQQVYYRRSIAWAKIFQAFMVLHFERIAPVKKILNSHLCYFIPHHNLTNQQITFSISNQHLFLFCSYPCPQVLSAVRVSYLRVNILSNHAHLFHNFFSKNIPSIQADFIYVFKLLPGLLSAFFLLHKNALKMNCKGPDTPIALVLNTVSLIFIRIVI